MNLTINIGGRLVATARPLVMGIVNVTPDSFYAGSRADMPGLAARVAGMLSDGADIIDLGGYSTRPGAAEVDAAEELRRLEPAVALLRREFPDIIISVDTWRAEVAERCVGLGADIVNDISGGDMDPAMFGAVARMKVPYILMHTRGTPAAGHALNG